MLARESMARALGAAGVEVVCGVAGDANLFLIESLTSQIGASFYAAAHESGAVLMADGYSRASGRIGVASVTHGPGLTNTLTALVEAVRNRSSLLLLAGDTPDGQPFHLQNIDQRELVKATGAGVEAISDPSQAARIIERAVRRVVTECRPIVVIYPSDLLWAEAGASPEDDVRTWEGAYRDQLVAFTPGAEAMDRALGILLSARRPVILAGRGAVRSGARESLLRLAERLGAPVATTLMAKDWFADHPANLGICGTLSTPTSSELLSSADCVVAFGAALSQHTTVSGGLLQKAAIIHCDSDIAAFDRYATAAAHLLGDARATADAMVQALEEADTVPGGFAQRVNQGGTPAESETEIHAVTSALDQILPSDRIVAFDAGRYMGVPLRRITLPRPEALVFTCNFGSIGLGMGQAVGAGLAKPGVPVTLFIGDGGFMLGGLAEFNTAVRYGVDLIVVLYNDGAYGAEYIQMQRRGLPTKLTEFGWPDFTSVAESLGGAGVVLRSPDDLDAVKQAVTSRTTPLLIDYRIQPAAVPAIH